MEDKTTQLVNHFAKALWVPVVLATIFAIASLYSDKTLPLIWLANLVVYCYILKEVTQQKEASWQLASWVGAIASFIIIFFVALAKLLLYRRIWYFFNLLTEPLLYAFLGALICGILYYAFSLFQRKEVK